MSNALVLNSLYCIAILMLYLFHLHLGTRIEWLSPVLSIPLTKKVKEVYDKKLRWMFLAASIGAVISFPIGSLIAGSHEGTFIRPEVVGAVAGLVFLLTAVAMLTTKVDTLFSQIRWAIIIHGYSSVTGKLDSVLTDKFGVSILTMDVKGEKRAFAIRESELNALGAIGNPEHEDSSLLLYYEQLGQNPLPAVAFAAWVLTQPEK